MTDNEKRAHDIAVAAAIMQANLKLTPNGFQKVGDFKISSIMGLYKEAYSHALASLNEESDK